LDVVDQEPQLLSVLVDTKPGILHDYRLRGPLLTLLKKSRHPAGLLCSLQEVRLLDDDAFRDVARGKISKIAALVRRDGRREHIGGWLIDSILSLPMLYESDEVQSALAEAIDLGIEPRTLVQRVRGHAVLGTSPIIHNAVIERLSYEVWDIWLLEDVVESDNLMQSMEVRNAVAKTLANFWSIKENARTTIRVDWDTSDYLWAYYLRPLCNFPVMGTIPEFQQAIADLLKNSDDPKGVLRYIEIFDGLQECGPVKEMLHQIEQKEKEEVERRRLFSRPLSDREIEKERRKAQEEAYWDHYRSYY